MPFNNNIPISLRLSSALIALAAVLVPDELRAEWQEEWLAEIWSAHEALASQGPIEFAAKRKLVWCCFGAFADASSLTVDHFVAGTESAERHQISNYAVTSFFGAYILLFLLTDLLARPAVFRRYGFASGVYSYFYWGSDTAL